MTTASELYDQVSDLHRAAIDVPTEHQWSDVEWLAYDEQLTALWESITDAAGREHAPLWAISAASEAAARHRWYATERRVRVERRVAL